MAPRRLRNFLISLFVIVWTVVFHYESTRHFYLEPLVKRPLPKLPFLFPPAGWIMFFNVDDDFSYAEVLGIKDGQSQVIDPHAILMNRTIGYDNINRNVLSSVLSRNLKESFCAYLERKFPAFDDFYITAVGYPSIIERPYERYQVVIYTCKE